MRALVSGNSGFLGSHFQHELIARGWDVDGFDLPTDALDFYRTSEKVYDLVVPAAYMVGGRAAIDGTNPHLLANVQLDSAMFSWALRTEQRRVLYFSSSAVYPTDLQGPGYCEVLREIDYLPFGMEGLADSNYGFAKAIGERMADVARQNGLPVTVVRPFSGYSEDQPLDYPFPSIVQRASAGDLSVWGPPGQTRDFVHVSDVVKGALAVVDSGTTDPVNLCTGRGVEMGELAQLVDAKAHGMLTGPVTYDESRPTGVFFRVGDPTRLLQYYTPQVTLEQGIERALRAQKE